MRLSTAVAVQNVVSEAHATEAASRLAVGAVEG